MIPTAIATGMIPRLRLPMRQKKSADEAASTRRVTAIGKKPDGVSIFEHPSRIMNGAETGR